MVSGERSDAICFARLDSGAEVAYRIMVERDGPTIVHLPGGTTPIEVLTEDPMYDRFLRTLGRYARLIVFDRPGVGASDAFDPDRPLTEQNAEAFVAVLDAIGVDSAWVVDKGGYLALSLARTHRERIAGTVMLAQSKPTALLDRVPEIEDVLVRRPTTNAVVPNPSRAGDPAYLAWHDRAGRIGASAAEARALYATAFGDLARFIADGEPEHPTRGLPAAVVHRRDARVTTSDDCEWWLGRFPGAEFILIDGVDETFEGLDAGTVADVIGTFITGECAAVDEDRPLVAVMFSDLVESTNQVAMQGDTNWSATLDRYETSAAAVVTRHHGRLVKLTGDGLLATFPSGSRALRAASELRVETGELGLRDRIGIHIGEVERRDDDIGGVAVHLAARVMGAAAPGQVLVTATVAQAVLGSRFVLRTTGAHDLKGFTDPWELFSLDDGAA